MAAIMVRGWAYVVDVVELDRNEIVGVDKQGIATVGSDEGCSRGQRCSYVAGAGEEDGAAAMAAVAGGGEEKGDGRGFGQEGYRI
ncbi:hypothetical protein B296_00006979 [Ensete ventricosum]|uniref:Uncharacterized protein n=1 Tax=Ensete ventricosum TaxID=4639 RepID=A0A426ZYF9_ENSVE|nr:hypothetical protein B296_00006979 [Ensete ventricosum]